MGEGAPRVGDNAGRDKPRFRTHLEIQKLLERAVLRFQLSRQSLPMQKLVAFLSELLVGIKYRIDLPNPITPYVKAFNWPPDYIEDWCDRIDDLHSDLFHACHVYPTDDQHANRAQDQKQIGKALSDAFDWRRNAVDGTCRILHARPSSN